MSVFIFGSFFPIIVLDIVISVQKKRRKIRTFPKQQFQLEQFQKRNLRWRWALHEYLQLTAYDFQEEAYVGIVVRRRTTASLALHMRNFPTLFSQRKH